MILHVTNEILQHNYGGIGTVVTTLYSQKTENEIFLMVGEVGGRPNWLPSDVHYILYDDFEKLDKLSIQADVTFVHNMFLMQSCLPGKKIFVSHSNIEMEKQFNPMLLNRFIEAFSKALTIAEEIVCVSEYEKNLLQKTNAALVKNKPIHVVFNGCETQLPDPAPSSVATLPVKDPKPTYGYIGRLDFRKGLFNLIEDFPKDRRLLIAAGGWSKYKPVHFRMMALSLSQSDKKNIIPLGYCQGRRKENFFQAIDALVIPSLYEPFGMTALEGMLYQKPVIVSKHGGLREIFGEDHPLYFSPEKPGSMAAAIQLLEAMTGSQRQALLMAQNRRLQMFSVGRMLQSYRQLDPDLSTSQNN